MDVMKPFRGWRALRIWALADLIGNMGLILTGALVRLTKSGLGCPTWPMCTKDSLVPNTFGLHAIIEFGNRTLTGLLVVLAIGTFLAAVSVRENGQPRHDIRRIAFWSALGVPAQAIIGGITVLTQLNPYVVASHLLVSVAMVVALTQLVRRSRHSEPRIVTAGARRAVNATFWLVMLAVVLGTLVTGSAPHGGDAGAARNGFDVETMAKIHAWTVWAVIIAVVTTVWLTRSKESLWVLLGVLGQGLVGYLQYFAGIPAWIVGLHMIGVAVLTVLTANLWFSHVVTSSRRPRTATGADAVRPSPEGRAPVR